MRFYNCLVSELQTRARAQTNTHAHTPSVIYERVARTQTRAHRETFERASERVTRAHATTARRVRVFRAVRRTLQTILVPLAWRTMHGRGPCGCDRGRDDDARPPHDGRSLRVRRRTDGRGKTTRKHARTHTSTCSTAAEARADAHRTGRTGTGDRRNLSARIGASAHTHTFDACVLFRVQFLGRQRRRPTTTSDSDATLGADDVFSGPTRRLAIINVN